MGTKVPNNFIMTKNEKIKKYEEILHTIQLYAEVTMDEKRLQKLISNICCWSYAHRVGDGFLSESEQEELIERQFDKLLEID